MMCNYDYPQCASKLKQDHCASKLKQDHEQTLILAFFSFKALSKSLLVD